MSSSEEVTPRESIQSGLQLPFEAVLRDDPRILWLKTIISNQLGVFDPKYVNELISLNRQAVNDFLNTRYERQEQLDRVIMFVWRTNYDKLVEEEITVLEEVPPPPPPEKKDKKAKKGRAKGGGGGGGGTGRKKGGMDAAGGGGAGTEGSEAEAGEAAASEGANETSKDGGEQEVEGEDMEGEDTAFSSGKSSSRSKRK